MRFTLTKHTHTHTHTHTSKQAIIYSIHSKLYNTHSKVSLCIKTNIISINYIIMFVFVSNVTQVSMMFHSYSHYINLHFNASQRARQQGEDHAKGASALLFSLLSLFWSSLFRIRFWMTLNRRIEGNDNINTTNRVCVLLRINLACCFIAAHASSIIIIVLIVLDFFF